MAAIRRLEASAGGATVLESEIHDAVEPTGAARLWAICGVGSIIAAKILDETHVIDRLPSVAAFAAHAAVAPLRASSGTTTRHRLTRGGNRLLNPALFTIALVQARPARRTHLARKHA